MRENIAMTKPAASLDEVVRAAQLAGAHEFIQRLPHGYSTMLDESASNLSGGQRQRLAIARALIHDPPVLVFDEATSALDPESEAIIQQHLNAIARGRTIVIISHRLSFVARSTRSSSWTRAASRKSARTTRCCAAASRTISCGASSRGSTSDLTDIGVSRPTTAAAAAAPAPRAVIDYDFQSVLVAAPKQRLVLWLMAGLIALAAIGLSIAQVDMIVAANGKVVTSDSQIVVQPFETSVVRSMAVKMGQKVKEGDVLATLDPTFTQADASS